MPVPKYLENNFSFEQADTVNFPSNVLSKVKKNANLYLVYKQLEKAMRVLLKHGNHIFLNYPEGVSLATPEVQILCLALHT